MIRKIRENGVTTGSAVIMELELKSLKSVSQFATKFNAEYKYLNLLVNNGKAAERLLLQLPFRKKKSERDSNTFCYA